VTNSWISVAAATVTAILVVNGLRRHGWARFSCLSVAVVVLVGAAWFELARVGNSVQSQENSSVSSKVAGPVRWQGRVTIPPSGGLELDPVPPRPGSGSSADINAGPAGQNWITGTENSDGLGIAPWTGAAFPGQAGCLTQLISSPQSKITIRPGAMVCVQTAAGRTAALRFVSAGGQRGSDVAEAVVWQSQ
jgi:hypothetical protein